MKSFNLVAASFLAFAWTAAALAETPACPFQGSVDALSALPGYKAVGTVDPVKVLDQLSISEAEMIRMAVAGPGALAGPEIDTAKAWAVFTDVPHFYNGGRIEYFSIEKDRYALVSYAPGGQQRGFIARLKVSGGSLRDLRKAHFEPLAELDADLVSCLNPA